jgi:uncharacterized RDD family membrane protein YckC
VPEQNPAPTYPGQRLGLPDTGRESIGRFGRRLGGFAVDAAIAALISYFFFSYDQIASLVVFGVLQILGIATIGGSIGHRVVGLRVVKLGGGWVGMWRPLVRTLLLILLVPALIWNADHRGLHDIAAGTMVIRW